MYYIPQVSSLRPRMHPTQWVGDQSAAFIEQQKDSHQPWMLFSSYIHPHPPFAPPWPWHKLYRSFNMPPPHVPEEWASLQTYVNRRQNRYKYRDQGIDNHLVRNLKAHYYACISFIDYQIGRLLDALDATEERENTLILFTSDHQIIVSPEGVITIPAVGSAKPSNSTAKIRFMPSDLGGMQLHYNRLGTPEDFEYTFNAPAAGKYALTARVVTTSADQHLMVAVNGAAQSTDIAVPFTVGAWQVTPPVEITLTKGKNVLKFSRPDPVKGLTIKDFTLTPVE